MPLGELAQESVNRGRRVLPRRHDDPRVPGEGCGAFGELRRNDQDLEALRQLLEGEYADAYPEARFAHLTFEAVKDSKPRRGQLVRESAHDRRDAPRLRDAHVDPA